MSLARCLLATALLTSPLLAHAALPTLEPEPGLNAHVEQDGESYRLQQPDGSWIELQIPDEDIGNPPRFSVEDYDFDGRADLAISVAAGMVNENYHLYLYRPALKRYELLPMPAETLIGSLSCSGFSGLERKVEERALYSHCRSGPRWYYDALRFDDHGQPWLYKTLQVQDDYSPDYPYLFFPLFEKTFDIQGKVVASRAMNDDNQVQTWTVPAARLYLYQQPDQASRSQAYLIQGDVCEVLARKEQWLQIRYASRKGPLERWISLDQAYDLHQRYSAAPHPDGVKLSVSDFSEPTEPLFSLGLSADRPLKLEHAEVHLLFTAADGNQSSHRLYAANHEVELNAGEGYPLDDNYIERRDGQYLIYHADEQQQDAYVPFFPALAPGRYRVRVVLTDPGLTAPVYAAEEVLIDYPPAIAEQASTP
ncbi:XAC2610-related protein [Pseudomonas sp. Gutcm_11s]|uniref:XAC2610-related protein n=1 Tax=Pseudomonas sp. Gutcm_11s TaxID=3026088 RepID=UPI0023616141|nr:hypothetical protein [Pseudomonas sp. Gutcm_11s]MDD0843399.1 hypothetical protein [Pseudomonas sp. Gutcm_11s]